MAEPVDDLRSIGRDLAGLTGLEVRHDVPLAPLSWYRIGGPADIFCTPRSVDAAAAAINHLARSDVPWMVLGDGTNLLIDDAGYRGVILRIGPSLSRITIRDDIVDVEAGAWVPFLALAAGKAGLSGIEHVVGIPGRMGGLVVVNGGSLRRCISSHLIDITWADELCGPAVIPREACGFAYRRSRLQDRRGAVLRARLRLDRGHWPEIRAEMRRIMRARRLKFPLRLPNCGSVFLSSPELFDLIGGPGKAIEQAGLGGRRAGAAEISPLHCNFIVNRGGATARDVLKLVALARSTVRRETGIAMDCEVRYVRSDGRVEPAHVAADALSPLEAA